VSVNGTITAIPQVNKVWGIFNSGGLTAIVLDVVGSQMSLSKKQRLDNKIKIYEWFYSGLESLIKSTNLALSRKDNSITYLGNIKLESASNTSKKKGKGIRRLN
jgi:hypothetical protein